MSAAPATAVQARQGAESPPHRPGAVRLAAVVLGATIAAAACLGLLAMSPYRAHLDPTVWLVQLAANLFTIAAGLVGWRARPGNRVGPLLTLVGFASLVDFLSLSGDAVAWTVGDMWNLLGFVVLAHVYLAFPGGRTAGWSRRLAVAVYAWFFAWSLALRGVDAYPSTWPFRNPFLLWPDDGLEGALSLVANIGALVLTVLVVGTVLDRWRRGSPVARRALAPVFWVSPITLVVVGTYFLGRILGSDLLLAISTGPLAQMSNVLLPAAFLAGLLQTRLERSSIADLVRELDAATTGELESALARAIHDPTLRLAFATPDGLGYVDVAGRALALPSSGEGRDVTRVRAADRTLAVLVHDPAVDPRLVESAAAASRLALENARLAAELRAQLDEVRASRERLVLVADDERRRLERDLHDGAQQRLVALGFALRQARRRSGEDTALAGILDEAADELEAGLRELRELARGIHPTGLVDGLAPALRAVADRWPIPVALDVEERRLPAQVESAAYFIVAEALTNAARHADARRLVVTGHVVDGALELSITDDGQGGAVAAGEGSGLRGLVDRAEAVGGALTVQSRRGAGTVVRARLPVG